jgi:hypothetical protein
MGNEQRPWKNSLPKRIAIDFGAALKMQAERGGSHGEKREEFSRDAKHWLAGRLTRRAIANQEAKE